LTPTERAALAFFDRIDPERGHDLSLTALRLGLGPRPGAITSDRLSTQVAGLTLPNPVGLAAGFDKDALALPALMVAGFGFVEVGAATPRPQPGNPRPRLFRLSEDQAAINRFGFNNSGAKAIATRLARRPAGVPVGLNIGANKDSLDRAADYAEVVRVAGKHADFLTVNVSSPNTERLRDLQGAKALSALLAGVIEARGQTPVWLKVAPDLSDGELADVAAVAGDAGVDAIVATNTTVSREGVRSCHAKETGGLSGRPLFEPSTRVLAKLSRLSDLPLVGVGGVASAEDALAKITAGASAVQLYTGLVYGGLSLASEIARNLDVLLRQRGFACVAEAVGTGRDSWL
jgi:dihydroorotate dehydrogenase